MRLTYKDTYTYYSTSNNRTQIVLYIRRNDIKRKQVAYYLKQKLVGAIIMFIGIALPILLEGDGTASLFIIPLGTFLLLTKEKVMMF